MNQPVSPDNPRIVLKRTADYRDSYANSVQVRLSVWDFLLVFGTLSPQSPEQVEIEKRDQPAPVREDKLNPSVIPSQKPLA